jgi:hypothetical protein
MAMSSQMRSAESVHKGKALTGKSRASGEAFDPSQSELLARGADLQNDRPRPSPTRYPIDQETFVRLKEQAKRSRTGKVAKRGSIVVRDKGEDAAASRAPAAPSEVEARTS